MTLTANRCATPRPSPSMAPETPALAMTRSSGWASSTMLTAVAMASEIGDLDQDGRDQGALAHGRLRRPRGHGPRRGRTVPTYAGAGILDRERGADAAARAGDQRVLRAHPGLVRAGHRTRSEATPSRERPATGGIAGVRRTMLDQVMPDPKRRRGLMLVMSSPSGAGKTSLSRRVLELEPELALSISVTTRPRRPGEIDGVHYLFIDQPRFDRMTVRGELLEHARVYSHSYGTPRAAVEQALASGRDVLFDIDWQRASNCAPRRPTTWSACSSCRLHCRSSSGGCAAGRRTRKRRDPGSGWPRCRPMYRRTWPE